MSKSHHCISFQDILKAMGFCDKGNLFLLGSTVLQKKRGGELSIFFKNGAVVTPSILLLYIIINSKKKSRRKKKRTIIITNYTHTDDNRLYYAIKNV